LFFINAGAIISTFTSPIFRGKIQIRTIESEFQQDTCYPLAFEILAALMMISTVVFVIDSPWYKKKPPTTNIFKDVAVVIKV
jgi:dipeptide/tripeptide permease